MLSAGTMCSGSDSPIVWLQALSRAVYQTWRIVVVVEHAYAVEATIWKQAFLKDLPCAFQGSADLSVRGIAQVLWRFLVMILSTRIARCKFCDSRCIDGFLYPTCFIRVWNWKGITQRFPGTLQASSRHFEVGFRHSLKLLFARCEDLLVGRAVDVLSGDRVEHPKTKFKFYGFPCDDVSRLNTSRSQHGTVVQEGSKRTGSVFQACSQHCAEHEEDLEVGLSENVLGLAAHGKDPVSGLPFPNRNLDHCISTYSKLGFWSIVLHLDSKQNQRPVDRTRLWMPHIPKRKLSSLSLQDILI